METFGRIGKETNSFRFMPGALRFMEKAETITVFEGLPHQTWEPESLKKELGKTEEILIGDFPFYPTPAALEKSDHPALLKLLSVPEGLRPFIYFKMCGGFHPDYAIRFTKEGTHCHLLLCFGCGDAGILHDNKVIHCHIGKKGWQELLSPYAKFRPFD